MPFASKEGERHATKQGIYGVERVNSRKRQRTLDVLKFLDVRNQTLVLLYGGEPA